MEATKAANLVEHEADIYSRPARTWFQTPRQKAALAEAARADAGSLGLGSGSGPPAAGDKRKRDKEAARQERKRKRGQEEATADKRRKNNRLIEVSAPDAGCSDTLLCWAKQTKVRELHAGQECL